MDLNPKIRLTRKLQFHTTLTSRVTIVSCVHPADEEISSRVKETLQARNEEVHPLPTFDLRYHPATHKSQEKWLPLRGARVKA